MRPRSVRLAALFLALLLACLPACSKKVTEEVPLDTPDAETTGARVHVEPGARPESVAANVPGAAPAATGAESVMRSAEGP